jgi:putative membrane protein
MGEGRAVTIQERPSADQLAAERTDLAATRTLMAADRTLMAWIRTALALLSFGFTIYKVFQELQLTGHAATGSASPRNAGLFLAAVGTLSMVMGTVEYWELQRMLRHPQKFRRARPALILALLVSMTGGALFLGILARLF